jgi:hypothetical protein
VTTGDDPGPDPPDGPAALTPAPAEAEVSDGPPAGGPAGTVARSARPRKAAAAPKTAARPKAAVEPGPPAPRKRAASGAAARARPASGPSGRAGPVAEPLFATEPLVAARRSDGAMPPDAPDPLVPDAPDRDAAAAPDAGAAFRAPWPGRAIAVVAALGATVVLLVLGVIATGLAASKSQGSAAARIGASFVDQVNTADGLVLLVAAGGLVWAAAAGAPRRGPLGTATLRWVLMVLAGLLVVGPPLAASGYIASLHKTHQPVDLVVKRQLATFLAVTMIPAALAGVVAWWSREASASGSWPAGRPEAE